MGRKQVTKIERRTPSRSIQFRPQACGRYGRDNYRPIGATKHQFKDLSERDFSQLEGKPEHFWKDIYKQLEKAYGNLPTTEKWKYRYAPYIESNNELSKRFLNALSKIANEHMDETVLIGTHAGCIRTTLIKAGFCR